VESAKALVPAGLEGLFIWPLGRQGKACLLKLLQEKYEMSKIKFRPLHDRVLVRLVQAETKTAGGIIIPDSAAEKPMQGEIVAVGNGHINDNGEVRPLDVKEGDKVIFSKWAGTEVTIDGEDLMVMKESDIIGVVAA
jgi:chaperonin GroES